MIGIISLLLVVYTLLFITRIATIILVYTGLSQQIARFQARSAVTGCGYTTQESELVTTNIARRKVISHLMLIGNVGIIASISSLLLSWVTVSAENYRNEIMVRLLMLCLGLMILWYLSKNRWFERIIIKIFEVVTQTQMQLSAYHLGSICHLADGYRISEVFVTAGSRLAGKSVKDALPILEPLKLLGIQHQVCQYIGAPAETDVIQAGDALIIYGHKDAMVKLVKDNDAAVKEDPQGTIG